VVADLVAVLLPLKRFLRQPPQKVCCNFNNIEQIFPGAAALGAGSPNSSPLWEKKSPAGIGQGKCDKALSESVGR